jgi:hypothetical protein
MSITSVVIEELVEEILPRLATIAMDNIVKPSIDYISECYADFLYEPDDPIIKCGTIDREGNHK